MKKIATLVAVALALVLVAGAPASADSPDSFPISSDANKASFWVAWGADTHQETDWTCVKDDEGSEGPFVIGDPPSGSEWRLIVVKAGSTSNDLHWNPVSGDSFEHSVQRGWSHVIVCSRPISDTTTTTTDPETTTTTVPETTTTVPETTTTVPETTTTAPVTTTDPVTTVPTTTPSELPDTGADVSSLIVAGLVLLMSGGLILLGITRRAENI